MARYVRFSSFGPTLTRILKASSSPAIIRVATLRSNSFSSISARSFSSTCSRNVEISPNLSPCQINNWDNKNLDVNEILVESAYDGPKFDGNITKEFIEEMTKSFKNKKKIHEKYAYKIILAAGQMISEAPSLVDVAIPEDSKLTVCGNVYGQFDDLINIFETNGVPSEKNMYLFNGGFVDYGPSGLEVILTLLAYKLLYPSSFYLNRGNHETDVMNKNYGFKKEVETKFSETMFELFSEAFGYLPLAHLINKKILVVHGGLPGHDNITLDEIKSILRFGRAPLTKLMGDLLWAVPTKNGGRYGGRRTEFGPEVTEKFLENNDLDFLIRSHQHKDEGYEIEHNGKCITVFSAPNYFNGNKGAIINIAPDLALNYKTFEAVNKMN